MKMPNYQWKVPSVRRSQGESETESGIINKREQETYGCVHDIGRELAKNKTYIVISVKLTINSTQTPKSTSPQLDRKYNSET